MNILSTPTCTIIHDECLVTAEEVEAMWSDFRERRISDFTPVGETGITASTGYGLSLIDQLSVLKARPKHKQRGVGITRKSGSTRK